MGKEQGCGIKTDKATCEKLINLTLNVDGHHGFSANEEPISLPSKVSRHILC